MSFLIQDLIATIVRQDAELGQIYSYYLLGCLIIGLALGLYGLRLYYLGLALLGSIVGFLVFKASGAEPIVSIFGAIIFGAASVILSVVMVFLSGFIGSLSITLPIIGLAALQDLETLPAGLLICLGVSLFIGLLAVFFQNIAIIFSTSIFGAGLIAFLTYKLMDYGFWNSISDVPVSVLLLSVLDPNGNFASAYDPQAYGSIQVNMKILLALQVMFSIVFFLFQLFKLLGIKPPEAKKPIKPNIIQRKFETFTQDRPRVKKMMLKIFPQLDPFWREKQWDELKSSWSETLKSFKK